MPGPSGWDPGCYLQHEDARSRPFHDLVEHVPHRRPARVVDLGCGPGNMTATLLTRWPDARVTGVDNSPAMIEAARKHAGASPAGRGRLDFRIGDARTYDPRDDGAVDVLVSNAALHWVPGHTGLLARWMDAMAPGGTIAFQVPDNFDSPNHALLTELRNSTRWRTRVGDGTPVGQSLPSVRAAGDYLRLLIAHGCESDVWETTYYHVLTGEDAVLEWMMGTSLRPVLDGLPEPEEREVFAASYRSLLANAYRPEAFGTVLTYRRIFVIARKPQG